jgi:hypothetical protein
VIFGRIEDVRIVDPTGVELNAIADGRFYFDFFAVINVCEAP